MKYYLYWSIFTLHQNFIRFYVLNETAVYLYIWMAYFLSSDFTVVLGQTYHTFIVQLFIVYWKMADLEMSRSDLLYALDILQPTLTSNLVIHA
jgi:hypothetical protein